MDYFLKLSFFWHIPGATLGQDRLCLKYAVIGILAFDDNLFSHPKSVWGNPLIDYRQTGIDPGVVGNGESQCKSPTLLLYIRGYLATNPYRLASN
jgi:hypothetical protein